MRTLARVTMRTGETYHVPVEPNVRSADYADVIAAVPPNNWWDLTDVGPPAACNCCYHPQRQSRRVLVNTQAIASIEIVEDLR